MKTIIMLLVVTLISLLTGQISHAQVADKAFLDYDSSEIKTGTELSVAAVKDIKEDYSALLDGGINIVVINDLLTLRPIYISSSRTNRGQTVLAGSPRSAIDQITDNSSDNDLALKAVSSKFAMALVMPGVNNHPVDTGLFICVPPSITVTTSNNVICAGQTIVLTTQVSPVGSYTYSVSAPAGVILTGATTASATATNLSTGVNTFTVTVSNGPTCFTTAVVSVSVNAVPLISLSSSQSAICLGQTVNLSATGISGLISYGVLGPVGNLLNPTTTSVFSPTATTTYIASVVVPILGTTINSCPLTVVVNQPPVIPALNLSLCVGTSLDLASLTVLSGLTNVLRTGGLPGLGAVLSGPLPVGAGVNLYNLTSTSPLGCTTTTPLSITGVDCVALTITVLDPGTCQTATDGYTSTGVISLTNALAGFAIVTDGTVSLAISLTAGQTSAAYSLTGLISGSGIHTVTVAYQGKVASTTYSAPVPCQIIPQNPLLSLEKFVSQSKAKVGDVLTYSLVLTNTGLTPVTTTVRDSLSTGATYLTESASVPSGTIFLIGQPVSLWNVPSIGAGQSLTLTFQVHVDSTGILYNVARIPGDTANVCTSVPVKICTGDKYTLTVPAGRSSYHWYKDNMLIVDQTSNVLIVTGPGTYSLGVDNVGGMCPDFSCCPFIVELDSLPVYQAVTIASTCQGSTPQNNGRLVLNLFKPTYTYQYSLGASFNSAAPLSGLAKVVPANGVIATSLSNPGVAQTYTVRMYNQLGCYTDQTVLLLPTICGCPVEICVPSLVTQTKRPRRIGDLIK